MEDTAEFPAVEVDEVEEETVTEVEDVEVDEAETERLMDEEPDEDGGVEEDDE